MIFKQAPIATSLWTKASIKLFLKTNLIINYLVVDLRFQIKACHAIYHLKALKFSFQIIYNMTYKD